MHEVHGFDSLPLYVRPGAVIPVGSRDDRPDYDYLDGLTLEVFPGGTSRELTVTTPDGTAATFTVERGESSVAVSSTSARDFAVRIVGGATVTSTGGRAEAPW